MGGNDTGSLAHKIMISSAFADIVLLLCLLVTIATYVFVSRRDRSYINILTPAFVISIPGYYLLPLFFNHLFGADATTYAYTYVFVTLTAENAAFVYAYTRPSKKLYRLPLRYAYNNFALFAFGFLALAILMYAPVLLQFPEYVLDPRQLYIHTRTGFGINFYISSTLSYLSVILILFSRQSRWVKGSVIVAATAVLALHGSKVQMFSLVVILALFFVYVREWKVKLLPSLLAGAGMGLFVLLLFAATMTFGDNPADVLEEISQYSDYTRNAMLVIDSHFPLQYGRLTLEAQTFGRVPRLLMPSKPTNFGVLYLDDQFFPESLDAEAGAPDFGMGFQYADFGALAIVYLAIFAILRGWLARAFVDRLRHSRHPADFFLVTFLANIAIFPIGGIGWLLPEAFVTAALLCLLSRLGAQKVYRERTVFKPRLAAQAEATNRAGSL